jgi:hypothetical protein
MNDTSLQSPASIGTALSEAGYSASHDDSAAFVELQHEGKNYPAVIQLQGKELLISCQICKIGDFGADQLALVATNALAANVEMLPYAFAILKPEDSGNEEAVADSPLVIINSVPVGDFSTEELLWAVRKLQVALATAVRGIETSVTVSKSA